MSMCLCESSITFRTASPDADWCWGFFMSASILVFLLFASTFRSLQSEMPASQYYTPRYPSLIVIECCSYDALIALPMALLLPRIGNPSYMLSSVAYNDPQGEGLHWGRSSVRRCNSTLIGWHIGNIPDRDRLEGCT